jgi:hypothetical protein
MKPYVFFSYLCFLAGSFFTSSSAQSLPKTLGERLGFPRDAKLVIIHADDVGVTHPVNSTTIQGLETGLVNSASIMLPCPWFPEIADYAKAHSSVDFGLHLTLTLPAGNLHRRLALNLFTGGPFLFPAHKSADCEHLALGALVYLRTKHSWDLTYTP